MAEIIAIAVLVLYIGFLSKPSKASGLKERRRCGYPVNRLLERIKSTSAHTDGCTFKRTE